MVAVWFASSASVVCKQRECVLQLRQLEYAGVELGELGDGGIDTVDVGNGCIDTVDLRQQVWSDGGIARNRFNLTKLPHGGGGKCSKGRR